MKFNKAKSGNHYYSWHKGYYISIEKRPHKGYYSIIIEKGKPICSEGFFTTSLPTLQKAKKYAINKVNEHTKNN